MHPPSSSFLRSLVPFLFSPGDDQVGVPPALLSAPLNDAINFLSLSESDDRFWTLGAKDSEAHIARREIIECNSDRSGELKCLVPVSLPTLSSSSPSTPILDIVLVHEPNSPGDKLDTDSSHAWKLLRLQAPSIVAANNGFQALREGGNSRSGGGRSSSHIRDKNCFPTIEQAIAACRPLEPEPLPSYSSPLEHDEDEDEYEYDEYGTSRRKRSTTGTTVKTKQPIKTREEMAEGEGTTPGAYGDSNDFWAGWSDSEEDEVDSGVGFVNDTRGSDVAKEDAEEDSYWKGYGAVQDQVDDGRTDEPQESPVIGSIPAAAPGPEVASPARAKTRSRRSSTVTPFKLTSATASTASTSASRGPEPMTGPTTTTALVNVDDKDRDASFLSLDSPNAPSAPFEAVRPPLPSLVSAVNVASIDSTPSSSISQDEAESIGANQARDDNLRFALAGIWGMYKGHARTPRERDELQVSFERIVAQVLRS
ncbi:uncharacterized protein JCM15063_006309 [Sporobolomyces koalae]|uniref:uncharacterized protein n=1 Tax=Sporobolomyces koalae TaxID=500713 RepID=UPI00317ABDFB